jgi:hypothetical protein
VHLLVDGSGGVIFLTLWSIGRIAVVLVGGGLPAKLFGLWLAGATTWLEVRVLAQWSLDVLGIRIHLIKNLLLLLVQG